MRCIHCQNEIHKDRVTFLELTNKIPTCVNCSTEEPALTLMNFGHKTGGEVFVVPNNPDGSRNKERVRQATRAFRRAR